MSPTQLIVALALLTTPPNAANAGNRGELTEDLRPAVQQIAIQLEILDPREEYLFADAKCYPSTLELLQARYRELADAPRTDDARRFPERCVVNELLAFNRSYRQNVDARRAMESHRESELTATLEETDRLYQAWDQLREARTDYYFVTLKRQALKRLRELVGVEAYYSGVMPPYVPIWRFQAMD
jgi:hypothetical protein